MPKKSYTHMSFEERETLSLGLSQGQSLRTLAAVLAVFLLGLMAGTKSNMPASEEGLSRAEYDKRRAQITEFFEQRRNQLAPDVVATTKTKSGQTIEWIMPQSQMSSGRLATPLSEDSDEITQPKSEVDNPYVDVLYPRQFKDFGSFQEFKRL